MSDGYHMSSSARNNLPEGSGAALSPVPACKDDFSRMKLTSFDKLIERKCSSIKDGSLNCDADLKPSRSFGTSGMAPNAVEVQLKGPNWLFGQRKPAETFPTTKITPALETSYFLNDDCLKINCTMGVVVSTIDYSRPHSIQVPDSDIGYHFFTLLDNHKRVDVILNVGGERFHAHKLVLPARSSIFRSNFLYDESDGEKNEVDESDDLKEIIIDDMAPKVLK